METNYFGILKDFDFDHITKDNFPILISKDIFYPKRLRETSFGENYFGLEIENEPSRFINLFHFNNKEYHLSNKFYRQMYLLDKSKIENDTKIDYHKKDIDFNIDIEQDYYKKLRFIENKYLGYQSLIIDAEEYSLYRNDSTYSAKIRDFEDYYIDNLKFYEEEKYNECLAKFLKGKDEFYLIELKETWEILYLIKEMSYYLAVKKNEIQSKINSTQINKIESNVIAEIFTDDGFQMFTFLCDNYSGLKNPAFFSYIYQFLNLNKKILKNTKDNLKYRIFIKTKFNIKMSRIIDAETNVSYAKNDIFKTFETLLESYSE